MQKVEQKKVVIVTGGATGIGAACVRYFGERGWQVVVNYFLESDQSTAEALAGECSGIAVRGDVSHDADCRHIAHSALTAFGRIDALVSSAASSVISTIGRAEGRPPAASRNAASSCSMSSSK